MVVRLRLARHGTRNNPFYHVVAIAEHKPRDARPIEKLGEYDPIPRPVLARPGPAYAVTSSNAIGSPNSSLPIEAYLGKQNKGKERDVYSNQGKIITSGIPKEKDIKLEKKLEWNTARIAYWLEKGAQPSKTVARLLHRVSSALSWGENKTSSSLLTSWDISKTTKAGLVPEGKHYKGIWQPLEEQLKAKTRAEQSRKNRVQAAPGGRPSPAKGRPNIAAAN